MIYPILTLMLCLLLPMATEENGGGAFEPATAQKKKGCANTNVSKDKPTRKGASSNEKEGRTEAQRKIDSQLLYAIKQRRGETTGSPAQIINLGTDMEGRVLVDVSARVSPELLSKFENLGAIVVSQFETYRTIRARVCLEKLEALASFEDVRFIMPAAIPMINAPKTN